MWSSRLFWKLYLSSAGLILVAVVCFVFIVSGWQETQIKQQVLQRMHDTAVVVRSHVKHQWEEGRSETIQALMKDLGRDTESRITLVAPDGDVLADSDQNPEAMENHKNRVELLQAVLDGKGSSERVSPTLGVPMYYFALRAGQDGLPVGLVRVAVPMTAIHAQITATNQLIWLVAMAISLLAMVSIYWLVARIIRPVTTLTSAAESISSGDYHHSLHIASGDELGTLANAFNRMSTVMARRESELRQSGERLATVLSGMAEGVIAVDDREHILFANKAAATLFQFNSDDCQGRPLLETVRNHILHQAVIDTLAGAAPNLPIVEVDAASGRVLAVGSGVRTVMP